MEPTSIKIQKLRGKENWLKWRFVISTLLEEDDNVLDVVEGKLVHPGDATTQADARAKFLKADKIARKLIITTVEDKPLDLLLSCKTAREMWQKLKSVYDMKSDENLNMIQKKFFDFKWDESENIAHNLSKLEQLSAKMKALGSDLGEKTLITRILTTLPKKFIHFHSAWDSTEDAKKTLDTLTTRLITEESRFKEVEDDEETSVALVSKTNHAKKSQNWIKRDTVKQGMSCFNCGRVSHLKRDCFRCFICKKKGHATKDCWSNGKGNKGGWQSKNEDQEDKNENQLKKLGLLGSTSTTATNEDWVIDSGASEHMTSRREWFSVFEQFDETEKIEIGDGKYMEAYSKGNIEVETFVDGKWLAGTMYNVLYIPKMKRNLFSVKFIAKKGIDFSISKKGKECVFLQNGNIIAKGLDFGNLYKIDMRVIMPSVCHLSNKVKSSVNTIKLWHERLCHQDVRHVKEFLKNLNINVTDDTDFFCEGCIYGKHHRLSFHDKIKRATKPREIVFTDVCGPMEVESLGKKIYFLVFKDDFSKFTKVFFLRNKSEVIDKLKDFCIEIENQFSSNIKEIHSDGGKEFKNKEVENFLRSKGIKHTINVPYTPEQNGVAERENRTIVEAGRSMLYSKKDLPLFLWAEAINTAVYVINRTGPTKQGNKTPYELWHGETAGIEYLKIFGTECFIHIPTEKRRKLDKKAIKGYLVGYLDNGLGYRVYLPSIRNVVLSRDVKFKTEQVSAEIINVNLPKNIETKETHVQTDDENYESAESDNDTVTADVPRQLRDRHKIKQTDYYGNPIMYIAEKLPNNYDEAIKSEKKDFWKNAMLEEMKSQLENKTWILVEKPKNYKTISSRWVYTKKINSDNVEKYKAHLVIKGCSQVAGVDYEETYSPVARFDTIRLMLSFAAKNNLYLGQFDIKTAFLYGELKENIYMKQPKGFDDGTNRVCKLIKSLYGLKQSPRCWTKKFTHFISKLGFCQSQADACFYIYLNCNQIIFLTIYVDDGLIAASDKILIDKFLNDLGREFKITSTTDVKNYLGVEINRLNDGAIFIHQGKYIKSILERYNMSEANSVSTPIETSWHNENADSKQCNTQYREAVGNLTFLQTVTRPDISFAVNVVSRKLENPSEYHWQLIKRIFRYLKGTAEMGLLYMREGGLEAFSDADYAGEKETRKSTSGMICKYANAAITWRSKRQQCVALSTTEAEYISAASAAKEIMWLKKLFTECKISDINYILKIDNTSALKLVKNPEFHERTKHIDVKYHFLRDLYNKSEIDVMYVQSDEQLADIFTKGLPKQKFEYLRLKLGLRHKCDIITNYLNVKM